MRSRGLGPIKGAASPQPCSGNGALSVREQGVGGCMCAGGGTTMSWPERRRRDTHQYLPHHVPAAASGVESGEKQGCSGCECSTEHPAAADGNQEAASRQQSSQPAATSRQQSIQPAGRQQPSPFSRCSSQLASHSVGQMDLQRGTPNAGAASKQRQGQSASHSASHNATTQQREMAAWLSHRAHSMAPWLASRQIHNQAVAITSSAHAHTTEEDQLLATATRDSYRSAKHTPPATTIAYCRQTTSCGAAHTRTHAPHILLDRLARIRLLALLRVALVHLVVPHVAGLHGEGRAAVSKWRAPGGRGQRRGVSRPALVLGGDCRDPTGAARPPAANAPCDPHLGLVGLGEAGVGLGSRHHDLCGAGSFAEAASLGRCSHGSRCNLRPLCGCPPAQGGPAGARRSGFVRAGGGVQGLAPALGALTLLGCRRLLHHGHHLLERRLGLHRLRHCEVL